jgi:ABC-type multidrug transport system permease subunit
MDILQNNDLLEETSNISEESKSHLSGLAQWLNIAAILSFVSMGIAVLDLVLKFIKTKSDYDVAPNSSDIISLIFTIGITLLLNIILFQAAKFLKIGLLGSDQSYFNLGIRKLATYYRIYGILAIIMLVIFVLAMIVVIFAAASGGL